MLSPKYYPHFTVMVAMGLIAAPYALFLSLPGLHDGSEDDVDFAMTRNTASAADLAAPSADDVPFEPDETDIAPTKSTPVSDDTEYISALAASMAGVAPPAEADVRVAMVTEPSRSETPVLDHHSDGPPAAGVSENTDTVAVREMTLIEETPVTLPDVFGDATVPLPHETKPDPKHDIADAEHAAPPAPRQIPNPPSYFDATGHLAMAGAVPGNVAGNPATAVAPAPEAERDRRPRRTSRNRREGRSQETGTPAGSGPADASSVAGTPGIPWSSTTDEEFGKPAPAHVVDVILQQPLESRRVTKVENVVAVTSEKGWPIALVRSDLPDDQWWVQQMVGVRGRAFAARVNFGNEHSIPGSVYHMVIVFLDSPDEVRRFRIAKQFKELPEGLRRSRQFTFVRR